MKKIIHTSGAPSPIGPYSQAVQAGNTVFLSGQIAIEPSTGELVKGSLTEETRKVMQNIEAILNEVNLGFDSIVKTGIFLTDMAFFAEVNEEYSRWFKSDFPARETVQVAGLPKGVRVEISMIAIKEP
ncbi:MAG: RidA family protein [Bacteroidetes bacterium]|nr:RidA family protein [Bacteroidota bacterium]